MNFPTQRLIVFPLRFCPNVQLGPKEKKREHMLSTVWEFINGSLQTSLLSHTHRAGFRSHFDVFYCVRPQVSNIKQEDLKISSDNVSKMITDFQLMKGKQESMDSRISALKQYVAQTLHQWITLGQIDHSWLPLPVVLHRTTRLWCFSE